MTLSSFIIKIMAMPFEDKGRDYTGGDCYSVIYLGFRDVLGVELPKHTDEYEDAGNSRESRDTLNGVIRSHKRSWEQVINPQAMDVVLFKLGGQPIHVGLMIDKKNFIHCEKKIGTVIENVNDLRWSMRKEGFYRLCRV